MDKALHHVSLICDRQFQAANITILGLFAVNIKFCLRFFTGFEALCLKKEKLGKLLKLVKSNYLDLPFFFLVLSQIQFFLTFIIPATPDFWVCPFSSSA